MITTIKPLSNHKYAQARVAIYSDGTIALWSYKTVVIEIDPDGYLSCTGTYSRTTISHIGWFIKEYAPALNYYCAKHAYENNYKIHIVNGDIIPI